MKIENSKGIEGLEPILSNRPNVSNSLKKTYENSIRWSLHFSESLFDLI